MIRDIAVARVKQMLGFKKNLDAEIVQAMIEQQQDLERSSELPFFLRKKYSAFVTAVGTQSVSAPADFIREWDDDVLAIIATDGTTSWVQELKKDDDNYLRLRWPVTDGNGLPVSYSRLDKTFYFYPTPDKIYTLDGSYYAKDQDLSTNIENKWLRDLPFILVARAGLFLAAGLHDDKALASFGALNDIMTAKLHIMTVADDAAGAKPVIGGED